MKLGSAWQSWSCAGTPIAARSPRRTHPTPRTHVFCFCSNCTFFCSSLFWAVQETTLEGKWQEARIEVCLRSIGWIQNKQGEQVTETPLA